jgi:hypothetical protein
MEKESTVRQGASEEPYPKLVVWVETQVSLSIERQQPRLVKDWWTDDVVCAILDAEAYVLARQLVSQLMLLDIGALMAQVPVNDNGTQRNKLRAIELLQTAVNIHRATPGPVESLLKQVWMPFDEVVIVGQRYVEDEQRALDNLKSSLKRIEFRGDWSRVKALLDIDIHDCIGEQQHDGDKERNTNEASSTTALVRDKEVGEERPSKMAVAPLTQRLLDYMYDKFLCEWDLSKIMATLDRLDYREIATWFHVYCDQPDMVERLARGWHTRVAALVESRRGERLIVVLPKLQSWIKWAETHWTLLVRHRAFRINTIKGILDALAKNARWVADTQRGKYRTTEYLCTQHLLGAVYRIKEDEVSELEDVLAIYWANVEMVSSLAATGTDRQNLINLIVATGNQPVRRVVELMVTSHPTNFVGQDVGYSTIQQINIVARPGTEISRMSLDTLCECLEKDDYKEFTLLHLNEYVIAVMDKFQQCMLGQDLALPQGHDNDDDVSMMVHQMLRRTTLLLRATGKHLDLMRTLDLMNDKMTAEYNGLLRIFMEPIVVSLDGLREQCPCCATPYYTCMTELRDMNQLVRLEPDNDTLFRQLLLLTQLPDIERTWGLVPIAGGATENDGDKFSHKEDVEDDAAYILLEDDGQELSHCNDGDDDSDHSDVKYDEDGFVL